jgi:hypothetical protein
MALWGNNDNVFSTGTVSLNYTPDGNSNFVVTGSGTSFGQVGSASTGDVIRFGDRSGTYYGDAVIVGIASTTQLSIASTSGLSGASISGAQFEVSQLPKYTIGDVKYSESASGTEDSYVYGVDSDETAASTNTQYAVSHAGWVGVTTYMDNSVNPPVLRVKSEVLVAMSSIVNDAADDAVFPDRYITITSQPTNRVGIATTVATTFAVSATATPSASLSYQWQFSTAVGAAFTDVTTGLLGGLIYTNPTTATLGIAATTTTADRPNGYYFRVNITADGGASQTSDPARLTYA